MAQAVGLEEATGEAFLSWLGELKRRIGIPAGPVEAGVSASDLDRLSDLAFADTCHLNNPRPCTADDIRRMWTEALAP
jgi:hypothetical protein